MEKRTNVDHGGEPQVKSEVCCERLNSRTSFGRTPWWVLGSLNTALLLLCELLQNGQPEIIILTRFSSNLRAALPFPFHPRSYLLLRMVSVSSKFPTFFRDFGVSTKTAAQSCVRLSTWPELVLISLVLGY